MYVIIELNACLNTDLTKGERGNILIWSIYLYVFMFAFLKIWLNQSVLLYDKLHVFIGLRIESWRHFKLRCFPAWQLIPNVVNLSKQWLQVAQSKW